VYSLNFTFLGTRWKDKDAELDYMQLVV